MAIENDDLLYVYDTSEGEGKKIKYETLKSGGSGTGEFGYWNRTGTTLSPVNAGDSVSAVDFFVRDLAGISERYVYSGTNSVSPQFQIRLEQYDGSQSPQPAFNVRKSRRLGVLRQLAH